MLTEWFPIKPMEGNGFSTLITALRKQHFAILLLPVFTDKVGSWMFINEYQFCLANVTVNYFKRDRHECVNIITNLS